MNVDDAARLLIALGAVNWMCTSVLVYQAWRHRWPALVERAVAAVVLAVVGGVAAMLGFNRLGLLPMPGNMAILVLAVILVLVSVPSVVWTAFYLTGRFEGSGQ